MTQASSSQSPNTDPAHGTGPAHGTSPPAGREPAREDSAREAVLITVEELTRLLAAAEAGTQEPPVLLDVRWTLMHPDGREDFAAGHLPGARYVPLDEELSDHSSSDPARGRHPLPSAEAFEATANRWGVRSGSAADPGTPVIVYDDASGQAAARAWWLLRWAGHENVRVLDGGWPAWRDAGLPMETGAGADGPDTLANADAAAAHAGFTIRPGSMPVLSADEAAALAQAPSGLLLDARAPERYQGLTEPLDPVAGHIPGAHNAPAGQNSADGRLRSTGDLRAHYRALGALDDGTSVGAYCGSGVSASHTVLALASLGVEAALFPGSWSAWSNDPARPVATGEEG
ncbi:sulfurtransferase [Brevibacterium album]|uniref:sulfurtransferase n=1 Tax=Brevibacterium album TaxID=417948 RepID=UPI00040DC7E6|nr:sulfurtransferase [Brevibacterium album]